MRRQLSLLVALCFLGLPLVLTAGPSSGPLVPVPAVSAPESCPAQLKEEAVRAKYFPRTRKALGLGWGLSKAVFRFVEGQPRVWNHVFKEPSWKKKPLRLYQDWLHPLIRFLSPVWLPRAGTPTFPIFKALWRDPNFTPTEAQWAVLDRFKAREMFEKKKAYLKRHPYWSFTRKWFGRTLEAARITTVLFALNLTAQQMAGGTPNVNQYLNEPQYVLKTNQVRILNDTVPFPHTSIQIGDRVYSYGQTHLSSTIVNEYLRTRQMRKLAKAERIRLGEPEPVDPDAKPETGSSAQVKKVGGDLAMGALKTLGLDDMPQSLQAVTLNLTDAEVEKLQRYLEMQVGKQYANTTMVNDCATMVIRALEECTSVRVSRLIDASPSQISFLFAAQKSAGYKYVGPIYLIVCEDEAHPHLARNMYINILESKLFIDLVVFNQVNRLYIDATHSETALQHHDAVTQKVIEDFRAHYAAEVNADKQIALWEEETIPALRNRAKNGENVEARVRDLNASIHEYLDDKIAEADAYLALPTLTRLDILKYEMVKQVLEAKRRELVLKLSGIGGPVQG